MSLIMKKSCYFRVSSPGDDPPFLRRLPTQFVIRWILLPAPNWFAVAIITLQKPGVINPSMFAFAFFGGNNNGLRLSNPSNFLVARLKGEKKRFFWSKNQKNVKKQRFWVKQRSKIEISDLATRKFENPFVHVFGIEFAHVNRPLEIPIFSMRTLKCQFLVKKRRFLVQKTSFLTLFCHFWSEICTHRKN